VDVKKLDVVSAGGAACADKAAADKTVDVNKRVRKLVFGFVFMGFSGVWARPQLTGARCYLTA
jgi:hypothetical protein